MLFGKSLLATFLGLASAQAALDKQLAYPNGLHDPFDPGFSQHTKPEQHSIKKWNNGLIPEGCKVRFTELGIKPQNTEVYNVTYSHGCLQPWVFCRANNAQLSIKTMASLFGRLPLHMRALVRHPIAVPQSSCSALAYTDRGDIVMKGNCNTPSVWIHETGHQMDAMLKPGNAESDSYANVNAVEDFAQVTVVALYKTIRGTIPKPSTTGCFDRQLNTVLNKYKSKYLTYGGICNGKVPPSKFVKKTANDAARLTSMDANKIVVGECKFDLSD
ncbi:hypothetical protein ABW20_dc0104409 [Dactylellina cionopaga]|nr:hypothetical protein ABW20_dc0104409 [Dactylellina cionopaga]